MKVNLKKIGAIVAGATILASTAAFGALWYGNTKLVDENGAPVAKVVVGEKAAASDGVGAALIASRMMASAYKSVDLKGQVVGTATCTGGEGTGNCSVSDEKATLEITVPGQVAEGTYTINTLIGDYLNRRLLDRKDNIAADTDAEYPIGGTDVSENANPFTDGAGGNIGVSETFLYRVTGTMFSPLAAVTINDDSAAKSYKEQQDIWIKGKTEYSDSENSVVGEPSFLSYTIKFSGSADDFGIPVCTTPDSQDYNACLPGGSAENLDYATATHKVRVKFLGEDWVISDMQPPTTVAGTSETRVYTGGYVKLAKEAISGLINQGESLETDNLKFHLDDLEAHGDTTSAILSVLDANDNILKKDKIAPGETKEFNIQGKTYRVHVYKVAPGYTFGAKWADMAIYAKELKLEDGYHLDPDYDTNQEYQVILGWKDKGADGVTYPDHLRTIVLYADDITSLSSGGDQKMVNGDFLPIVQDPVTWKLTYTGLDITNSDRHSLRFTLERTTDYTISSSKGPLDGTFTSTRESCTITAPYVKVTSGKSGSVFEVDGTDGEVATTLADNFFYVATNGATCATSGAKTAGTVFMKLSPTSQYYGYLQYDTVTPLSTIVRYSAAGDGDTNWDVGGVIEIAQYGDATAAGPTYMGDNRGGTGPAFGNARLTETGAATDFYFAISEKAGVDTSNNFADYMLFGLDINGASSTFNYDTETAGGDDITKKDYMLYMYAGPVTAQGTVNTAEEGFVTERGSLFNSIDDTTINLNIANRVAKAQFTLTSSTAGGSTESTCQATLPEGGEYTCAGVKVKVTKIDETVGACTAGGASCTPDMSGVSAKVVDDTGAEVAKAYVPATGAYRGLVILDRDAVGVNTLVSVGGDKVNTVTSSLLEGSPVDWTTEKKIVKEVVQGSKIVVAGAEAEDTLGAVNDFIAAVREA